MPRKALECPDCKFRFGRVFKKSIFTRKTSCPKCAAIYKRQVFIDSYIDWKENRRQKGEYCFSAKKWKNQGNLHPLPPGLNVNDVVRGDKTPVSVSEAKFKQMCIVKGWKPHRPSWPDYLVETDEGFIFVEVKSKSDSVSALQSKTFFLMERLGLDVYIWRNSRQCKNTLLKWNKGEAVRRYVSMESVIVLKDD